MIIPKKDVVHLIVQPNPTRCMLWIHIRSTTARLYVAPVEHTTMDEYETNGFPVRSTRRVKIEGLDCYKGAIYGVSDTDALDVRVLELCAGHSCI